MKTVDLTTGFGRDAKPYIQSVKHITKHNDDPNIYVIQRNDIKNSMANQEYSDIAASFDTLESESYIDRESKFWDEVHQRSRIIAQNLGLVSPKILLDGLFQSLQASSPSSMLCQKKGGSKTSNRHSHT